MSLLACDERVLSEMLEFCIRLETNFPHNITIINIVLRTLLLLHLLQYYKYYSYNGTHDSIIIIITVLM